MIQAQYGVYIFKITVSVSLRFTSFVFIPFTSLKVSFSVSVLVPRVLLMSALVLRVFLVTDKRIDMIDFESEKTWEVGNIKSDAISC